jgi:arylsulfatase A-like enzyme
LIIFNSDHGEILGEYGGIYDHNFPTCPEISYIPIVLIHQDIEPKIVKSGIASLVDIFPTIIDLLNFKTRNIFFQGESLLNGAKDFKIL